MFWVLGSSSTTFVIVRLWDPSLHRALFPTSHFKPEILNLNPKPQVDLAVQGFEIRVFLAEGSGLTVEDVGLP